MAILPLLTFLNPLTHINLPFPILIHALGLSYIGLTTIFPGIWTSKGAAAKKTQEENPMFGVAVLVLLLFSPSRSQFSFLLPRILGERKNSDDFFEGEGKLADDKTGTRLSLPLHIPHAN